MPNLSDEFNKEADVERQKLLQDLDKVAAHRRGEIESQMRAMVEAASQVRETLDATREERVSEECARLQKQASDNARPFHPAGTLSQPRLSAEQREAAAERYRFVAEKNVTLRDKQAEMAREAAFQKELREAVDRALQPERRSERAARENEAWQRGSRDRDDFERER